jgi:predicted MPP superfamily phosphohydrolase
MSFSSFQIKARDRKYEGLTKELENEWKGSFSFVCAADTQFGLIDRIQNKKTENDDINWLKEIHYLQLTIQSINRLEPKPKFFIICGDLVDAFPQWSRLRAAQVKDLKAELVRLDPSIQCVCVCGNHDVGDVPTVEGVDSYKKDFGADYFSFWASGCKCIVLNSQLYFNHSQVPQLKQEQDEWLDRELVSDLKSDFKHLIVFQHIPLFLKSHDEPDDVYFNIPLAERKPLIEKLRKAGVKKVFCGHYHMNSGGFYEDLECIVTSAVGFQMGSDKHGYRLVEVNENEIAHKYITVSEQVN